MDITYLTPSEVKRAQQQIENLKGVLDNSQRSIFASERNIDRDAIKRRISEMQKMLNTRKAPVVSGLDKDKLYRRQKELESDIKKGMLTKDDYMGKRKTNPENHHKYQEADESAIQRQMKWQVENAERIREWKRIKRILDPDNPSATNVEQLRPNKRRS